MIFGPGFPLAGEERAKSRVMNRDSKFLESPPSQRHQRLPTSRQSQQFGVVLQLFGGAHHAFFSRIRGYTASELVPPCVSSGLGKRRVPLKSPSTTKGLEAELVSCGAGRFS